MDVSWNVHDNFCWALLIHTGSSQWVHSLDHMRVWKKYRRLRLFFPSLNESRLSVCSPCFCVIKRLAGFFQTLTSFLFFAFWSWQLFVQLHLTWTLKLLSFVWHYYLLSCRWVEQIMIYHSVSYRGSFFLFLLNSHFPPHQWLANGA